MKELLNAKQAKALQVASKVLIEEIQKRSKDPQIKPGFDKAILGFHKYLGEQITEQEIIEMIALHILTSPVLEALFDNKMVQKNPVTKLVNTAIIALKLC